MRAPIDLYILCVSHMTYNITLKMTLKTNELIDFLRLLINYSNSSAIWDSYLVPPPPGSKPYPEDNSQFLVFSRVFLVSGLVIQGATAVIQVYSKTALLHRKTFSDCSFYCSIPIRDADSEQDIIILGLVRDTRCSGNQP